MRLVGLAPDTLSRRPNARRPAGRAAGSIPEHPFFTLEHGWMPAQALTAGLRVRKSDGGFGMVHALALEHQPQRMYNLTVEGAHTFFVGDGKWLVHNACGKSVIGHFPAYVELAQRLGAHHFNIPAAVWNRLSDAQRWAANRKFLDRAIARGDEFILATPLQEMRKRTYFAREVEYLLSKGYQLAQGGTRLVRP